MIITVMAYMYLILNRCRETFIAYFQHYITICTRVISSYTLFFYKQSISQIGIHNNFYLDKIVFFQLTCQMLDSNLVEIEDSTENEYLKNVVKGLGGR